MPLPRAVLVSPPDHFDDIPPGTGAARKQWNEVMSALFYAGIDVFQTPPLPDCEEMVFCADPVFVGLDYLGRKICVPSRMRSPSRQLEVAAHVEWYRANGYRMEQLDNGGVFEGGSDALSHPGRRLIWGGWGQLTSQDACRRIGEIFGTPVVTLELQSDSNQRLDTCFCPIDEDTVLVYPNAFTSQGMAEIRRLFSRVLEVDRQEAEEKLACNAAAFLGQYVVMQSGSPRIANRLRDLGYTVLEVNTSAFLKAGGSVASLKMYLF